MRTPLTVGLVLLAILLVAGFAFDSDDKPAVPKPAKTEKGTPISTIERRVEQIRDLRYETLPRPQTVSPAQAKRDGLEDLDRNYPAARRHADEEVLKLLGLLKPDVDLRKVSGTIFGQGVATAVMFTYAEQHFSAEQTLGGLFSSLGQDTGDLPPFIEAQLTFPYVQGQEFIKRLYAAGGWGVVDAAYRFRPPASSEQIMHSDKYLAV